MSSNSPSSETDDGQNETGWSPRTKRWVALGGIVVVIVALALPKLSDSDPSDGPEENAGEAAMQVSARVVQSGSMVREIRSSGTLRADESVELTAEASGKVTDIRFEEGSRVQRGELLLQINDAELQAEKRRLEHQLQLASDRAERQKRLLAEGGVSQEEYDASQNEVEVLKAELDLVESRIDKTEVRAPFSGIVGLRNVSEGAYLSPTTKIATLQRVDPIKINLSVSEKYASQVQEGQPISFSVRGVDDRVEGEVYATETQVDADTRTLQLRARAPNPKGVLRPGMYADVHVELGAVEDAFIVPSMAVVPTLDGQRVFVVERDTARPRNVELGIRTDTTVQVTEGLSLQDTVITSGIQELRAGLPVRVESLE